MSKERPQTCSRCGAALPADAPQGLCPRCLGAFNFAEDTAAPGAAAPAQPPPSPEDIAPHFPQLEILECLGRGGMGVVYKARQKALGRPVALKILAPERGKDPEFAARFTREAQALARLDHPHIVTIHDFGQADGFFYLLMEFVDGVNLRQAMRAGRFTPQQALAVVPQICEALQFAHDRGIVHRDIKPENILLDRQGRVKIADFGVAKIFGSEATAAPEGEAEPAGLTQAKGVVGTPRYMAPEQVTHPLDVDHRADIYSLGVVLYEMLTGELPAARIEAPSKKVVIDVRLDEVVLRALATEPARRYQHASDVGTMVETIATTPAGSKASAKKSGMTRIMEIFFDITFTSPWAIRCLNASALGFLGFLSALRFLPFDELRWTAGFSGFFGLFGLIGAAFLIEMMARGKRGLSNAPSESGAPPARPVADPASQQVKGPAIGLIVTGILNWILIPLITMMIMAYRAIGPSGQPALWVVPIVALVLCSLTIFGALKMKGLESYGWALTAAFLAIIVTPGNIIGLPLGIWALVVLSRPDVRAAFRPGRPMPAVQAPRSVPPGGLPLFVEREGRRRLHWPGVLVLCGTVGSVVLGTNLAITLVLWLVTTEPWPLFHPRELPWVLVLLAVCVLMRVAGSRLCASDGDPGRPDWRLWSPSQPPLVREICSHMTEAEQREATMRGLLFGLWNAMTFFGPMFCVMFMPLPSPMNWIYGGAILIVGLSFYPLWRRMERDFLCSTTWARQRGIKPDQLRHFAPCGLAKGFSGLLLSILIALVLAFFIRGFVLEAYFATSDAVSPEIPRKSFVVISKLQRSFVAGDIIVYRENGRAKLGRVAEAGPKKGQLLIGRRNEPPVRLQVKQVKGKVIFNTRPVSGPEERPPEAVPPPAPQGPFRPCISRVSVDAGRAIVEGRAASDSLFVLGVGEGRYTSGFLNDLPFTAIIEPVDWGRGIACVIKDSIGNVLLTLGNSRIGPMTYERGRIVFREGTPTPEPDGSYVIGEFLPKGGTPQPFTVSLEKAGRPQTNNASGEWR
ncbi:MAG: serine/threonine protein kinase [Verrucomicrobiae bacterium]|nr:serine/threonine protein kinase [Verrucomicrobiae bacterium]